MYPYHMSFAAPLRSKIYGGLAPMESFALALAAMEPFGYSFDSRVVTLEDGRAMAVWSDTSCNLSVSLIEVPTHKCCQTVVSSERHSVAARFSSVLRKFAPLVELGQYRMAQEQEAPMARAA